MRHSTLGMLATGLVAAVLIVGVCGCASAARPEVTGTATPVDGWDGVKNVSRAGRFTFAGQPDEAALERFAADGGAVVIDLRTHEGKDSPNFDERAQVEAMKLTYVNIPFTADSFNKADVEKFAQATKNAKGPVLVHCNTSNRVGALWAAYLALDQGVPVEDAIAAGRTAGLSSSEAEAAALRVMSR